MDIFGYQGKYVYRQMAHRECKWSSRRIQRNYELTLTGATGVDLWLGDWRVAIGLDLPWIDVPIPSIPGMHISVGRGEKVR